MDWNTYIIQWKVLVRRNLQLKRRNIFHLSMALFLTIVATFCILYEPNQPYNTSAKTVVGYDFPLMGISNNFHLCVAPRDIKEHFLNSIKTSLSLYGRKKSVQIWKFEDEKHLNEGLLREHQFNVSDCDAGVIIIGNISTSGSYIVRVPGDRCLPDATQGCFSGILSNIQQAVDNAFLQEWTGNSSFKLPSTKIHGLVDLHESARTELYNFFKCLLIFLYFPIITNVTENAIQEKKMKIKESMLLMGMKLFSYWSALLFCEILLIIAIMLPISIALFIANVSSIMAILLHFLLWFGLGCSLVICAMTITHVSTQPPVRTIVPLFILYAASASVLSNPKESHGDNELIDCFAMLASTVAYDKGFDKIMREQDFGGASFAILMIFVDILIYSALEFILEYFFPYGITLSWGKPKPNGKNSEPKKCEDVHGKEAFIGSLSPSTNLDPCIKLEKIRKTYSLPKRTGLDGVTFSIFKGEVTCCMGPNGSGKSTLMKVISRVLTPDDGRITNATSLNLGVCPQENILHNELTIYEHLELFGSLKGIPRMKLDSTVTTLLESFDLINERDTRSKELSGGQKRKLCVAIAMIGNPEVLLLDEPSKMMNPQSRRKLWNLLQDYTKSGHSVLFTTHDMDEAELFSDRIALLNYGKLEYYGTNMDIKKQFGGGYIVRINLQSEPSLFCNSELVSLISDLPSKPKVILTSDSEIVVKLHSFDAAHCIEFFNKIEEHYKDIASDCFTISISALEELFFLLAEKKAKHISEEKKTSPQNETTIPKFTYNSSIWTKTNELIRTKCRILFRTFYASFYLIVPIIIIPWKGFLINLFKKITCISPNLYKNDIIQVINASGKPLTDFENSLSKLGMKFELFNSAVSVGEKNFIKTEIQNYGYFNETLDVNWNWTVSLSNPNALPAMQNLMSNILWKTWDDQLGRELTILVQPITIFEEKFSSFLSETPITLMHISFCLIYIAIAMGLEVLEEKEKKVTWIMSTTRNNALPYWISTFVCQFALLSLSFIVIQCLLLIFDDNVFQKFSLWIAFYLSIPGCLLTVYLMGQCFKSDKKSEAKMVTLLISVSLGVYLWFQVVMSAHIPYVYILNILVLFFIPIYAPLGLIFLLSEGETVDSVIYGSQWRTVCYLVIPLSNLLYALLIIYPGKWKTFKRKEKIQVMNQEAWDKVQDPKSIMDLKSVRKLHASRLSPKTKVAVMIKDLSMSFLEGEIIAFMGYGTEKSTLMKLLSFNEELTSGEISIRDKYMESITYCPKENTVWPYLTVEEHLRLFAALNGVPTKYADKVVESIMKDLLLKHVANIRAEFLSRPYQRKLSVALSLLGNSNLILLDEPTTGMDPISKQYLWKRLHQEFPGTSNRTLIVTTESSNEAELNCSRIGLFTDENLRCLGTTEAIKKEFSKGFQLNIKMKNGDNKKLNSYLESEIPEALEKSHKGVMFQYYIPRQAFKSMSGLFTAVAKIQEFESVEDCLISECTLNQIILEIHSNANRQKTRNDEYAVIYKV